jgi:glutathione synthase
MKKLLFIADPLSSFVIKKDSTLAMMKASQQRGHQVWHCQIDDLKSIDSLVQANCQQIEITAHDGSWFKELKTQVQKLCEFDAIIMRKDPPFDLAYVTATWFLSQACLEGAKVFNAPDALRNHSEKLALLEFMKFAPPTLVSHDLADIKAFHEQYQDVIIKPLDGMGGQGIFRIQENALNLASIVETLGGNGQRALMVQKFLPEIAAGDKRVLLIGGEVVPYGLARIPQAGEVRGNLASGGKGVAQPLTQEELKVAEELAPLMAARGLHLVGLDFIGGYLTEINVTSPTCFVEITEQTGHDVALQWLTNLEKHIQ